MAMETEYRCIIHYECDRVDKVFQTLLEATTCMQRSMLGKNKPIFSEIILVTTKRVAYQSRPFKETS